MFCSVRPFAWMVAHARIITQLYEVGLDHFLIHFRAVNERDNHGSRLLQEHAHSSSL